MQAKLPRVTQRKNSRGWGALRLAWLTYELYQLPIRTSIAGGIRRFQGGLTIVLAWFLFLFRLFARKKDIPLLSEEFLRHYSEALGKKVESISKEAMETLIAYDWSRQCQGA